MLKNKRPNEETIGKNQNKKKIKVKKKYLDLQVLIFLKIKYMLEIHLCRKHFKIEKKVYKTIHWK